MGRQVVGGAGQGFSNAIEVSGPQRTLYIAGQVASDASGHTPGNIEAQCHLVWDKIEKLLQDGQMTLRDVVKTTVFLTSAGDIEGFRKVRTQRLGDLAPASTLVVITALARPEFKVEVEAIASKDA
ncbi:RidA family protein [Bradyrhizobium sp. LHD-71]|uniref:RidA family protein n=1 Tax=Bradyrhizobium sp. LHD-71 TaxID=3072141 RepID=UPI00280FE7F2|nr:RidA family protein [Bradyrhizobium sp. LHD-71]MDQ8730152.1 RidA family protein [Bradyrhizobium sp. LHD-71]